MTLLSLFSSHLLSLHKLVIYHHKILYTNLDLTIAVIVIEHHSAGGHLRGFAGKPALREGLVDL